MLGDKKFLPCLTKQQKDALKPVDGIMHPINDDIYVFWDKKWQRLKPSEPSDINPLGSS